MGEDNYPKVIETYRGYEIKLTKGFVTDKLTARCEDDVHTRRFAKGNTRDVRRGFDDALASLKRDIEEWGTEITDEL